MISIFLPGRKGYVSFSYTIEGFVPDLVIIEGDMPSSSMPR